MIIDGITTVDGKEIDASELASIDTASAGNLASQLPGSNGIYNGKMQISQRGDFTTPTATTTIKTYFVDRWEVEHQGTGGATYQVNNGWVRLESTSAASRSILADQQIEDVSKYEGKEITVSAKLKSNVANARIAIFENGIVVGSTATSLTDGNENTVSITHTCASTLTSLVIFVAVADSVLGSFSMGLGDYIEFTDVRLDFGSSRLSGDREYGEELALCKRYYENNYPDGFYPGDIVGNTTEIGASFRTGSSTSYYTLPFKVRKRTTPTITIRNGVTGATGTWRGSSSTDFTVGASRNEEYLNAGVPATGTLVRSAFFEADAEL